ncbi:TonB-dependent receptor [Sphingomonas sp. LY54]|uniref:TonB-dependent receptor n=1 Tax=Sphingomonas sp. LY54 TaxID=3095343 RepID=UPI002D7751EB|nr:TonB-dependent receptor [Sphingomonas sp. LY54]WRP28971.1 TonB-dependent receptor [Sphingomonas sp. LY54]
MKSVDAGRVAANNARLLKNLLAGAALSALVLPAAAYAQEQDSSVADDQLATADEGDAILVTGIRSSLRSALNEKRTSDNLVEVIQAEDIGKLPDQNLAEVLENVTGIQITREAGVGNAVQIRGTDANRTEINGVSTVSSGAGRSGISFEDLPAALIASVEVTKVPEARTTEGSVGGTINLRTIRPLDLRKPLFALRVQGERSDLAESTRPRIAGTVGNAWSTGAGEFGLVLSGSYARQDVASFEPRVDRDNLILPNSGITSAESFPFLPIQFFDQELIAYKYETLNFTGSLEWKPADNLKIYFDGTHNDQKRAQQSTRVQLSGVSAVPVFNNTTNTAFETVDFGTLQGPNGPIKLGEVQAVVAGVLRPGANVNGALDPNLRTSSNTGARLTKSQVFALGTEWESGRFKARAEGSLSTSDSVLPNFSTNLDFINPNSTQPRYGQSLDNGVPLEFDLRNGTLQFGIAQGLASTPTSAQLLDPANYKLQQIDHSLDTRENKEKAFRLDTSLDISDLNPVVTSFDLGYRWNETSAENNDVLRRTNFTSATSAWNRPSANLFADIVKAGPSNFDAADGRTLFFPDYLIIDGGLAHKNPGKVLDAINAAIAASNAAKTVGPNIPLISQPTDQLSAFFSVAETTHAVYLQANFDGEELGLPVRGNAGVRWLTTGLKSVGNNIENGAVSGQVVKRSNYQFWLPRFNMVVEPVEKVLIRGGIARDIRRPDFNDLSTSLTFSGSANTPVVAGNPSLIPEAVWSFDIAGEWYFAPSSLVSVGFFHKIRTNLFADRQEDPAPNLVGNQLNIDITAPCEQGGIFNPIADRNINNPTPGTGICVPLRTTFNVPGTTTQTGIEVAFQHDLSAYEDVLGFASGFGFIGNFTYQWTGGSAEEYRAVDGPRNIFTQLGIANAQDRIELANLSKYAFNTTLFYDKYGLNARLRYTWRSSYLNEERFFFGLPLVNGARGQLNASVNYDVTDNINIGIEGINLLRQDANQYCVNNKALLCFQGLTDRRLTAGVSVKF